MTGAPPTTSRASSDSRLALDAAWKKYGHDAEYRERLVGWLRDHGMAVWPIAYAAGRQVGRAEALREAADRIAAQVVADRGSEADQCYAHAVSLVAALRAAGQE